MSKLLDKIQTNPQDLPANSGSNGLQITLANSGSNGFQDLPSKPQQIHGNEQFSSCPKNNGVGGQFSPSGFLSSVRSLSTGLQFQRLMVVGSAMKCTDFRRNKNFFVSGILYKPNSFIGQSNIDVDITKFSFRLT